MKMVVGAFCHHICGVLAVQDFDFVGDLGCLMSLR